VDDHPLMRRGINQLLSAVAKAHENELDLILLDLNMKGMSGLDTLKALLS